MDDHQTYIPKEPMDVFFFDFDGTLSLMEGIDELARMNGVEQSVHAITSRCMSHTGLSINAYQQRLNYIKPNLEHIEQLTQRYKTQLAPGALNTVKLLKSLGKLVYIISAGIKAAIIPIAKDFGISPNHVFAVDVYFDEHGQYLDFDHHSLLVHSMGKNKQISTILNPNQRALLVGDGINDCEAQSVVSRFIGFAGKDPKDQVREGSDFYINNSNIYPVLNLGLTHEESILLSPEFKLFYQLGQLDIDNGSVLIKEKHHAHYSNS